MSEEKRPKFGEPGYDLEKALGKLRFTKSKGPQYMTHVNYYECVAILDEIERLRKELKFIHEMAAEDIRADESGRSVWQIKANARAALGLKVEE